MRNPSAPTPRKSALFLAAACAPISALCASAAADLAVPAYSSRPGAAYTLYLDFGGFTFTGTWNSQSPGVTPAFGDATTSFTPADLADIEQIWSGVATAYAPFNINVTTVDPAVAAGKAATDQAREDYYDTQAGMMHTVIGGTGAWNGAAGEIGISFVGATPVSLQAGSGDHTNWVFSDDGRGNIMAITTIANHENGHGLGLAHQPTFGGTSASGSVTAIMAATINLGASPVRSLFATIPIAGAQNDDSVIANDANMGGLINDGIGHTMISATPIPTIGSAIDFTTAKGVIVPASSSNPLAVGAASYQPDYWSFTTPGGSVSITANSGEEFITPGSPDPDATLESLLDIYNSSGTLIAASPTTSLSETISTTLSPGTYYARVTAVGDAADSGATDFFDQGPYFLTGLIPPAASAATWLAPGSGTWAAAADWTPAVPLGAGSTASFTSSITASSTITLNANWTVGNLTFDNPTNSYTLAAGAGGSLTFDNGSARAVITVASGSHTISAPMALASNLTVLLQGPTTALAIPAPISGPGGLRLNDGGTLTLSGSNTYAGNTAILGGRLIAAAADSLPNGGTMAIGNTNLTATVQLASGIGALTLTSVFIATGSTLDLTNNKLLLNYGSPATDPVTSIASSLTTGYQNGSWSGTGITSSAAALNPTMFSIGYLDGNRPSDLTVHSVSANQIKIAYTLAGDAFLEGTVGFDDLVVVAQNFGTTGHDWAGGNFNYDPTGSVGFPDLVNVAQNFGFSSGVSDGSTGGGLSPAWDAAPSTVPEPTAFAWMAAAIPGLFARRRSQVTNTLKPVTSRDPH